MPCGPGEHILRWEDGQLRLPSHPDAEAELVLAALGGEKAGCVRLTEVWSRHTDDLTVLEIGPRGSADRITVGWADVPTGTEQGSHPGWIAMSGLPVAPPPPPIRFPIPPGHGPQQFRQAMQAELQQARQHTADQLSLLALGTAFQLRLAGHVAAAHAERLTVANRPALTAALQGRLAPVAADWIGIEPDQVVVSLHEYGGGGAAGRRDGGGWGSVRLAGLGADRRLRVALPARWLASVWACGLALVAGHLVVAVTRPGWPDAQVLALPAPGAEPVLLDVHGAGGSGGAGDTAHWET